MRAEGKKNEQGGGRSHRRFEYNEEKRRVGGSGGMRSRGRNKIGIACGITGTMLIVAVILLCSLLVLPGMIGFHMYNVLSGSMEPAISVGSILYVRADEPKDVEEDEIIAFYGSAEDSGIITHRAVKNNVVSGTFITKGDANDQEDPTPVPYDNYIGSVVLSIPYFGRVLTIMTSLEGKIGTACVVGIGVVLNLIGGKLKEQEE